MKDEILLLGAILITLFATSTAGNDVCFTGYVMDTYCLNRGTMLDNPKVSSLEQPGEHSVHCLVDVSRCRDLGYELLSSTTSANQFCRAYVLDNYGNVEVIKLARELGACKTCKNGYDSGVQKGFQVTVKGTTDGTNSDGITKLQVTSVQSSDNACPNGNTMPPSGTCLQEAGQTKTWAALHGSFMLLGWGIFLPSGVLAARYLRHLPDNFWFKLHQPFQIVGLLFAIGGWIVAITKLDTGSGFSLPYLHGIFGTIVMVFGLMQPLNAFLRPHPPAPGKEKSPSRMNWEKLHHSIGYFAFGLGLLNVAIGTQIVPNASMKIGFSFVYACALSVMGYIIVWSKRGTAMDASTRVGSGNFEHEPAALAGKPAVAVIAAGVASETVTNPPGAKEA